jgi:hypothetical protein
VVKALCYKPEKEFEIICSIYLILPTTLGPGVHSASNRNEYQKQKIMFLGSKMWPVHRGDNVATICKPIVESLTSYNSIGLRSLLWG